MSFLRSLPLRKELLPAIWTFGGQDQGAGLGLDIWDTAELQLSQTILPYQTVAVPNRLVIGEPFAADRTVPIQSWGQLEQPECPPQKEGQA